MEKPKKKQNELGTKKIKKLLLKQSLPSIIGLVSMSLYNVVDTIFIGQSVGTVGIAALAIAAPIQMIIIAIAQTMGIGASSIISRALGEKNHSKAKSALGNFFTLVLILGLGTSILGLIFLKPLELIFGATTTILPYANDYLTIIFSGAIFMCFTAAVSNIIRAEGNAKFAMAIMLTSTIFNIILDPILIFGFNMGIKGAAIATVIAQIISSILALQYFISGKNHIKISLKDLKIKIKTVKEILAIGASSLTRHSAGSIQQAILNHSLGFYGGDIAIAAIGIIFRLLMVTLMPMVGFSLGMQPILGFNYGANKIKRAKQAILYSIRSTTIFSVITFIIVMIFTRPILSVFTSEKALLDLATHAARIIFIMTPLIGFQMITNGVYQALGKSVKAIILSLLRQLIILVPLILILPMFLDLDGIFIAFPISDLLAGIITAWMLFHEFKIFNKKEQQLQKA